VDWHGAGRGGAVSRMGPAATSAGFVNARLGNTGGGQERYDLNASQQLAAGAALTQRLTLIQGPPGTGKTKLAVELLRKMVSSSVRNVVGHSHSMPILATSDSNIAVDNLLEGLIAAGVRAVRVGRPEKVRPELIKHCLDPPPPERPDSMRMCFDFQSAGYCARGASCKFSHATGAQAPKPQQRRGRMNKREMARRVNEAQVVCATCVGVRGGVLERVRFSTVLVDEATQATAPATLVPVVSGAQQLILIGDHCQLQPTVLSQPERTDGEATGLRLSLFSQLVRCGVVPHLLNMQYRMHPAISAFPSDFVYRGRIEDGVAPAARTPPRGFAWPRPRWPVAFLCVPSGREQNDGPSYYNEAEALKVVQIVKDLIHGGLPAKGVGVIAPYSGQVRFLKSMLQRSFEQQGGQGGSGKQSMARELPEVEVSSVDGFQGREKEVVVFSAVRANPAGQVGFLADWRRLNVMLTRARSGLIVVGHRATLRQDPTWRLWIEWAGAHGVICGEGRSGDYNAEQVRAQCPDPAYLYAAMAAPGPAAKVQAQAKEFGSTDGAFNSTEQRFVRSGAVGGTQVQTVVTQEEGVDVDNWDDEWSDDAEES